MRSAQHPQGSCGGRPKRQSMPSGVGLWCVVSRALAMVILLALFLPLSQTSAFAQDPSLQTGKPSRATSFKKPRSGSLPSLQIDQSQPLYLQGDELIYDSDGNAVTARGNVEIYYNNYILTADEVVYDQGANTLTAVGNVLIKEPNGSIISADRYTLTDDFRDGFVQSLTVVAKDDTKIAAEQAVRREGNITEFKNAKFTPCKTDGSTPPLWCIAAQRVIHNQQEATITYYDAQFEVLGVPIFYLPYFQHADPSVKRRSGFLLPTFAQSDDLGFGVEVPYYFALAPNFDFTFRPMYLSKQNVLWQGDWRHRLANGQYTVKLAAIDQDGNDLDVSPERQQELDGLRGSIETKGLFSLSSWWDFGWDITLESDDTFRRFYKLDNILLTDRVNKVFLTGLSNRNYFGATFYHFGGLLLEDTPQAESSTHPIVDYNYVFSDPILGGELRWDSNALSFSRGDFNGDGSSRQALNRAVTELSWRRRFIDPIGITYTPFGNLRGDVYQYDNFVDPITGNEVDNDTIVRGVATGGVTVSYPWVARTANASHVLEPIGQIVARQASITQDNLPNEDAKSLIFDDTTLFEIDKFSGYDRIETGTRANVGVQYTFQSNTGGYARFLAGQSYQLSGDNPFENPGLDPDGNFVFNPRSGLETSQSDYVLGAYLAPTDSFRILSQSRFNEHDFDLRRQDVFGFVSFGPLTARATYTFAAGDPELGIDTDEHELLGGAQLQLTEHWSVGGNIRYDVDERFLLSETYSVRYGDECFVLTASYKQTQINDPARDLEPDRTVYLQFELKHLGEFGYKTDSLDFIYGDDQPPSASGTGEG